MYQPKKYLKKDKEHIFRFIAEHPFATMVLKGENLLATHIPVLTEGTSEDFRLFAHIANHNEQFQYLKNDIEILLIFQGPHAYISSSWYREKDISTWDYSAVHVNARLKVQTGDELKNCLDRLVQRFEKSQENPLYFRDLPQKMVEEHLEQITGFWCEPFRIQAISKLHQKSEEENLQRITKRLDRMKTCSAAALSDAIRKENGMK
ncbi:MAG: FMN-binding negative transcriptional regulator [Salegentibacter sp.]